MIQRNCVSYKLHYGHEGLHRRARRNEQVTPASKCSVRKKMEKKSACKASEKREKVTGKIQGILRTVQGY